MQLVETGHAAGCIFHPSMAAMLAGYWSSLTRRGSSPWLELALLLVLTLPVAPL